jgi:hypothetical protein
MLQRGTACCNALLSLGGCIDLCSSRRSRRATDDHLRVCTLQRPKDVATIGALRVTGDSLSFPCSLPPARPRADPTVPRHWQPTSHNVRARTHTHARTHDRSMTLRSSTTLTPPTMCDDPNRQLRPLPHLRPRPSFVRFAYSTVPMHRARRQQCAGATVAAHATQDAAYVQHYRFASGPVPQAAVWLACRSCRTRSRRGQGRRASRQDTPTR